MTIELECCSLTARYECGDCGSKHQLKAMIDHKAGCSHE